MKRPPRKRNSDSHRNRARSLTITPGHGRVLTGSRFDYAKIQDGGIIYFADLPKAYPIGYRFAEDELSDIKPKVIIKIKNIEALRVLKEHVDSLEKAFEQAGRESRLTASTKEIED